MPGTVITFDALHANHKTMERIVLEKDADYLIQVKGNSPNLKKELEHALRTNTQAIRTAETIEKAHGRIETRRIEVLPITPVMTGWPHTHTVCRVTRLRKEMRRGIVVNSSKETSLYVGSFAAIRHSPEQLLKLIREHWTIENCLHHPKDRSMNEDRCRASEKGIGRVMCCLRSTVALLLGRAVGSLKVVQRRLASNAHLLIRLIKSTSPNNWLNSCRPYQHE